MKISGKNEILGDAISEHDVTYNLKTLQGIYLESSQANLGKSSNYSAKPVNARRVHGT